MTLGRRARTETGRTARVRRPRAPGIEPAHARAVRGTTSAEPIVRVGISYRGRSGMEADAAAGDGPPAWFRAYCRELEVIELCSTFERLMRPETARAWVDAAPTGFSFDIRAFRPLTRHLVRRGVLPSHFQTHLRRQRDPVHPVDVPSPGRYELWERFRTSLEPLRSSGKLGTVILRFPGTFVPDLAGQAFLSILTERLPGDKLAVELPPAWFTPLEAGRTATLLRRLHLGVVGAGASGVPALGGDVRVERVGGAPRLAAVRLSADQLVDEPPLGPVVSRIAGRSRARRSEVHVLVGGDRPVASVAARRLRTVLARATTA